MEQERNELMCQNDAKAEKLKNKFARMLSWGFSNFSSVLFPIAAVLFAQTFKINGKFEIKDNYAELLIVAISICTNLIMQLNSKEYNIENSVLTFIRVVVVGILVVISLAYGASKTISENEMNIDYVFWFSIFMFIFSFVIGMACECRRQRRN